MGKDKKDKESKNSDAASDEFVLKPEKTAPAIDTSKYESIINVYLRLPRNLTPTFSNDLYIYILYQVASAFKEL